MGSPLQKIIVEETHMDKITYGFNQCEDYVGEIIAETMKLKQIIHENYKGRASAGVEDYFNTLYQHLDVLKLCYGQLADYTNMVKEVSMTVDKLLVNLYNKGIGGVIK
jgi:uncharacterized protein YukE